MTIPDTFYLNWNNLWLYTTYSYRTSPPLLNRTHDATKTVYGVLLAEAKVDNLRRGFRGGYVASPSFPVHTF